MMIARFPAWRGIVLSFCAAFAAAILSGCATEATSTKSNYSHGELKSLENATLDHVFEASKRAISDMEFSETSADMDAAEGLIEARSALERKVKIRLRHVSDTTTEIRIRIDLFGNEAISRQLLDHIHAKL